jgi:RNA polymerase sigma-70 factor (ECF subfamily)
MLTPEAQRIWEAIDGLPEEEREAFDLVRIQGLTQVEAAGIVGTSVKTVQRRLNRARLLLAERLADLQSPGSDGPAELSDGAPNKVPAEPGDDSTP